VLCASSSFVDMSSCFEIMAVFCRDDMRGNLLRHTETRCVCLQEFEGEGFDDLCMELKKLSTECNKYRAKKDRRQQRSSFRDILNFVESGDFTKQRIQVSIKQCIYISLRFTMSLCVSVLLVIFHVNFGYG